MVDVYRCQRSDLVSGLAPPVRSGSDLAVDLAGSGLRRRGAPDQGELMSSGSKGPMQGKLRMQMTSPADEGADDVHVETLSGSPAHDNG